MLLPEKPGFMRLIAMLLAVAGLAACAHGGPLTGSVDEVANRDPDDRLLIHGLRAAEDGDWEQAREIFSELLRGDVRNARLQFLNGLAYEQLARRKDRELLDLALVGYRNAVEFANGNFWANLYLGFLELEKRDYPAAQQAFAGAVTDQPERWEALFGLGVASYYAGDVLSARLAAERARTLAPANPRVARLAAFAFAAAGEGAAAEQAVRAYQDIDAGDAFVVRRVSEILREVRLARLAGEGGDGPQAAPDPVPADVLPKQIMVDVTIVLSSLLKTENRGINLLDGLTAQYGYSNIVTRLREGGERDAPTRLITQTISVPTLNYNLNLFNDSGQYYQVLARPTLTAFVGRESQFFAGRTVNVSVSGVNLGTLQPIDVGVELKVTPESIDGRKVTFQVAVSRSFLSREEIGTFDESLTTFKEVVSATAEVAFGQTLLLSALSESVKDANFSRVPVLGRIPGPNLLTSRSSTANRRESLLILLTPGRVATITTSTDGALRPSELETLLRFWKEAVDPAASIEAISNRLGASRFFTSGEAGDIRWSRVRSAKLLDEALTENVNLARH